MASATVITGSTVETIEAVAGPTRRSPTRKAMTGRTVETTATPPTLAQPLGAMWARCGPPPARSKAPTETAAAVMIRATKRTGSVSPEVRSATRM